MTKSLSARLSRLLPPNTPTISQSEAGSGFPFGPGRQSLPDMGPRSLFSPRPQTSSARKTMVRAAKNEKSPGESISGKAAGAFKERLILRRRIENMQNAEGAAKLGEPLDEIIKLYGINYPEDQFHLYEIQQEHSQREAPKRNMNSARMKIDLFKKGALETSIEKIFEECGIRDPQDQETLLKHFREGK